MDLDTSLKSLCIAFSGITARVYCSSDEVYDTLQNQCRHLISTHHAASVDYGIFSDGRLWHLQRDSLLLYSEGSDKLIVQRLLHDISTVLASRTTENILFHAAAIAKNGAGVIIPGATGSGKSTFAIWHALGGYDFLTDELVAVSPDGASMWGFIQPIRLRPGSRFLLPYLAHVATAEQVFDQLPDGVVLVSPDALGAGSVTYSAEPRMFAFPQYAPGQQAAIRRLSVGETVYRLTQLMLNGRGRANSVVPFITALAKRVPAIAIHHSGVTLSRDWIEEYWPLARAS